jgi:hypothetical protein
MSSSKTILIVGGVGIGGLILWALWKENQVEEKVDAPITPDDPDTDDVPPDSWSGDKDVLKRKIGTAQLMGDLTTPTQEGGLRNAPGSLELDSRVTAYGKLKGELKAHDTGFQVEQGAVANNRFVPGRIYRLEIEGEEGIIARFDSIRFGKGNYFTILNRPNMSNWNRPGYPSQRTAQFDEQNRRLWEQYSYANPVYSEAIKRHWLAGIVSAITSGIGETFGFTRNNLNISPYVWVNEIRHDCQHSPTYDSLGDWRTWDAQLGACRDMSSEEQAAAEVHVQAAASGAQARMAEQNRLRNVTCMALRGVSCWDWNRFIDYYNRSDRPTLDEMPARIRRMLEVDLDTDFYKPRDVVSGIVAIQSTGTPLTQAQVHQLSERLSQAVYATGDDTLAERRARGEQLYQRFNPSTRWKYLRDLYSIYRWGLNPNNQSSNGADVIAAMGGFYGVAAKWDPRGA